MNCNIVINQQPSLPTSERSAPKTKTKDQKRVEAVHCQKSNNECFQMRAPIMFITSDILDFLGYDKSIK